MKQDKLTEEKAENSKIGGVLIGKRQGQTIIHDKGTLSGYLVGKTHAEGGIKAINKSTGQPLEMQGGEVVITAPAVADQTKREFEGQMLTNREILSKINEEGGGVSFAKGGDIPNELYYNGKSYNYGGKMMTDYEIMQSINDCSCNNNFADGGLLAPNGKPSNLTAEQYKLVRTPEFKAWFGDWENDPENASKVVDENGEPMVVYHGTNNTFTEFTNSYNQRMKGFYFSNDLDNSKTYGEKILSVFINIKNPLILDAKNQSFTDNIEVEVVATYPNEKPYNTKINLPIDDIVDLVKNGKKTNSFIEIKNRESYDGVIFKNIIDPALSSRRKIPQNTSVAFEPNQIKLADGTNTTFNKNNNDIRFDYGGGLSKGKSIEDIASMHKVTISHINSQLQKGIEVESEHTSDKKLAEKIAKDHLVENPNYYTILDKVGLKNGGQINLVKDFKKGDHPSRDLNNYNDLMDIQADGEVGGETGLELTDGVGGADASGGVGAFNNGGVVGCYADGGATLSAIVFEWDKVPTNYRNISKVKKVPFSNNPMDKGLDSIISPFLGKDELKPVMTGINFDDNGITATNAHILITLPYPNKKYDGVYDVNKAKKSKSDEVLLINEKYPNYEAVIPKSENAGIPYLIDVYKLLQYTKTALNYTNKVTYAIAFKYGEDERIGLNGKFLTQVLTTALKLGHEKLYAFITAQNRAMVLSPNKNYELGNDELLLTMPVMLTSAYETITGYGTSDPDYNRSLKVYFDFNDSEIHNADGSVAEFKMQYENNLSVDDNYLSLLSKITRKYYGLPILNYVKVENGKMTATDLDISLIVKDVNMPDGIYEIVNKAPNITMNPIEDFPKLPVFKSNEVIVNHNGSKPTAFEFITFSEVFEFYLDKLLLSVGKDELRPVMSGICIKKTSDNELFLVTTNAHTFCKINITEYCEFDKDDRELEYILPVKYLNDFVKLADGSLHFKCSKANIFIESNNLEYIGRTIDGKYPNYDAIIPRHNTKKIVFDHVAMNKCLKSLEVANQVAKYKGDKDIVFTLSNEGNNLFLKVQKDKGYNAPFEFIDKIQLCEIDFNYQQVDTNISLDKSVFLLMPFKDEFKENQYFAFRKDFFEVMLNTITDTEVECYFSEYFRAYIFPIEAIDYKKTLPEEKTKQQPKKKAESKKKEIDLEKQQVREAIETLLMLAEIEENEEQRKEIYEALEVINMLKEESFESGGIMSRKLTFEPIRTPLN